MNIPDALVTAVMGWAVVFLGIALLVLLVAAAGRIMTAKRPERTLPRPETVPAAPAPAPREPEAPGTAGDLMLYDTPDRDAAMIMAIVADELKIPLNELRFISIREVHKK